MTELTDDWIRAFGRPDPSTKNGVAFPPSAARSSWTSISKTIGAGWFKDRFLFLFGEGAEELSTCLDAWSFVVPKSKKRVILGRNAYGAILFVDDAQKMLGRVFVVDPTAPHVFSHPDLNLLSLLGTWLPEGKLDLFLDDSVHRAWRKKTKKTLGADEILAMKVPRDLGGEMKLANFEVENIFTFYETTAPIYEKALGKKPK